MKIQQLKDSIAEIPDYPQEGVLFRDITTALRNGRSLALAMECMEDAAKKIQKEVGFDVVVGTEARGFVFAPTIAYLNGVGFVMARKKGKLPREVNSVQYDLEYGHGSVIEMHKDDIAPGSKVLLVDDLIATGGTLRAVIDLVENMGSEVVGVLVLMELAGLGGADLIAPVPVHSVIRYEGA